MRAGDVEHDQKRLMAALESGGVDVPRGGFHATIDVTGLKDPVVGHVAKLRSGEYA